MLNNYVRISIRALIHFHVEKFNRRFLAFYVALPQILSPWGAAPRAPIPTTTMPPPPPLLPPVTMTSSSTLTRYAIGLDSSAALTTPKIKPKRSPLYTATCSATATSTPRRPPPTPPPPGPDSIARGFRRCFLSGVLTCFIS